MINFRTINVIPPNVPPSRKGNISFGVSFKEKNTYLRDFRELQQLRLIKK